MAILRFKDAEAARNAIMVSQKKEIAALYEDWANDIGDRAKFYSHKTNASAQLSERYYKELQKQLRATSQEVSNEVYKKIKNNIYMVSDAVVSDNVKWLSSLGFSEGGLNAAFSYVPDDIVRNLVTGQIYEGGWNLSKAIWSDNEKALKDIYKVMAKGVAENKPIYNIAKELEAYVNPNKRLPWNLTAKDGVRIYKRQVDYNAQRLARTLVQHGYQQSFIATTEKNPFITEYVWISNGSRVCPLCLERDGQHYKKDELPMDHPNGMCTMEPVVVDNLVDQLADWFNSPDGTYPEIDEFAGNFGYTPVSTNKPKTLATKEEVLRKIHNLKESGSDDAYNKAVPFKLASTEEKIEIFNNEGVWRREENDLGNVPVKVDKLITAQPDLVEQKLIDMVNDNVTIGNTKRQDITVVLYDNKYIIVDGNHRSTLAKLYGYDELVVHLRKLPKR